MSVPPSSPTAPPAASPLKRVLQETSGAAWWGWYVAAAAAALLVPAVILVCGLIAQLLAEGGLRASPVPLGRMLTVPIPESLLRQKPLDQLLWLVAAGLFLALLHTLALFFFYRGLYARSRCVSRMLHERVLGTSIQVAAAEGISAQRSRTRLLIDEQLPMVHQGLIGWWRAMPRSVLLALSCILLALAVDVWLATLAIISGLIVWRLYRWLEHLGDRRASTFDLPTLRRRLVEAVQTAPLIARVRGDETPVDESGGPLGRLMEVGQMRDHQRARLIPAVTLASGLVVALLTLALGGAMLEEEAALGLPSALVLALSLGGAVTGAVRVIRSLGQLPALRESAEAVYLFSDRARESRTAERMGLAGLRHAIELSNVTLPDGSGRPLLSGLSLRLEPGSVVAVLGTEPVAVGALVELLLGFGQPKTGRVTVDDIAIHDLHERWLSKQVLWIGRSGPLWSGTITDNLSFASTTPDSGQISDATRRAGVYDRLQSMGDGFSTLITADDGRLDDSTRYGLAIARALIRKPAVVIVQEPPAVPGSLSDEPAIDALCELARSGSLVVILPQRQRTLRMADRVVLLNGGRLAGEGRHEELLASSDLYRHLNYVLFNPYRHLRNANG
ncbi:ATP-binding cassette domain-containing protein [Candidatus Laterigemmans baculatus]|uniref:ATP-binding cassette domain-containing protein n=1 Tax=Candidatus Laterigemmans baculatus TaxID=2770505 RepID=UPI0013DB40CF|nr:ABC transporter ATP-binding protein [Candidatus Laterigemmans baculatus]